VARDNGRILSCENAAFICGGRPLFSGVTVDLRRGDCVLVTEGAAAERRLLLRGLIGLLPLAAGTLRFYSADGARASTAPNDSTLSRRAIACLWKTDKTKVIYGGGMPLQARWHSIFRELSPLTASFLDPPAGSRARRVFDLLGIDALLDRRLLSLSNGEAQRVLLAEALGRDQRLLLLEEPFSGLDAKHREGLREALRLVLPDCAVLCAAARPEDAELEEARCVSIERLRPAPGAGAAHPIPSGSDRWTRGEGSLVLELQNAAVEYGAVQVLRSVSWKVRGGERWAVLGPNGSGKSSLLSLIYGDNPQIYLNRVLLHGRRLGVETPLLAWKARLGYAAPDLLRRLPGSLTVHETILTGFSQTLSPPFRPSVPQREAASAILAALAPGIEAAQLFGRLERLDKIIVLMARAAVHDPALLLFDELEDGLSALQYERVKSAICSLAARGEAALIMTTHLPENLPACISHELLLDGGSIREMRESAPAG